jgi:hypothetical protein
MNKPKNGQIYVRTHLYQGAEDTECTLLYLRQGTTQSHEAALSSKRAGAERNTKRDDEAYV